MIIAVCDPKGIAIEAIKTILYHETAALLRIMYIVPEEERVYIRSILRDLALIDDK